MDGIEDGTLQAVPQPAEGITLAPKITVEDAQVDWAAPALRVDRVVRGCTPAPGAWTIFRGERLKLIQVAPRARTGPTSRPGELAVGKNNVYVGHRVVRRRAALGPGPGQEADAGRRLGARGADRAGRVSRRRTPAQGGPSGAGPGGRVRHRGPPADVTAGAAYASPQHRGAPFS